MPGIRAPRTAEKQGLNCLPSIRWSDLGLVRPPQPLPSASDGRLQHGALILASMSLPSWAALPCPGGSGVPGGLLPALHPTSSQLLLTQRPCRKAFYLAGFVYHGAPAGIRHR